MRRNRPICLVFLSYALALDMTAREIQAAEVKLLRLLNGVLLKYNLSVFDPIR